MHVEGQAMTVGQGGHGDSLKLERLVIWVVLHDRLTSKLMLCHT